MPPRTSYLVFFWTSTPLYRQRHGDLQKLLGASKPDCGTVPAGHGAGLGVIQQPTVQYTGNNAHRKRL